jgi:hypothetical protein
MLATRAIALLQLTLDQWNKHTFSGRAMARSLTTAGDAATPLFPGNGSTGASMAGLGRRFRGGVREGLIHSLEMCFSHLLDSVFLARV